MITFTSTAQWNRESAIFLISQSQVEQKKVNISEDSIKTHVLSLFKSGQFAGEQGEVFPLVLGNRLVLLTGIGKQSEMTASSLRIAIRKAVTSSFVSKMKSIEVIGSDDQPSTLVSIVEGILIGGYSWKKYVSKDKTDQSVEIDDKEFFIVTASRKLGAEAVAICEGVRLTRDLINDNADVVTSDLLEETIKKIIRDNKQVSVEILNEKEMKAKGLNLHLAVNQGSRKEPKLIIVKYSGANAKDPYTALVGKGITFDTGGLNIKPTGSIETMRGDMSGAAAVIGTLKNTLALNIKKNVIFAVAIAENAIGSASFKPGDVFKGYSGKTVEIGNTDAEGRLVLADAIAYVIKNYQPEKIIDVATLTGACVIALGHDYTGLVSTDEALAQSLLKSGEETDDRIWRLPSYPEMKNYVKSQYADIKNVGLPRGAAGACTAAEFLRQFANGTKWAHMDIAGTAFVDNGTRMYFGYGATGSGVRLLTHFLRNG